MTAVAERRMTVKEFFDIDVEEGYIYELINGIVMRRTSPNLIHQEASANIHFALMSFIKPKNLGKVYAAPMDVYLNQYDLVVPDLSFVATGNPAITQRSLCIEGVPDLIIEILSKGTQKTDRGTKMKQYEANKVPEYWIVDPRLKSIEVYAWRENSYEMVFYAEETGEIQSNVLAEFSLDITQFFGAL